MSMDKVRFKNLFNKHYRPLCNYANRILRDMDASEDVVQDVFLKLWNNSPAINITSNTESYIYTMVRNQALGVLRKSVSGSRFMNEMQQLSNHISLPDVEEAEIEKYQIIDNIYVSIRQLPPKCGEIFTLSKIKGLTYTQIADRLGISVKTVEGQMSKAFRLLRSMLKDLSPFWNVIVLFIELL
ncbi:MAG TPA: RNA polymerase sigma-70 factor [Saprospiraceae bacterium]|nr:RNA polymerase sigma-70 factor [Saprospiraceae bacterium]HRO07834.1 RNA polymerase sigma-70 factor [Saprospiraceae bacterium]HRP41232.1 RNA polymerase sigma-70 factor [Saprospiraceae bacterium]